MIDKSTSVDTFATDGNGVPASSGSVYSATVSLSLCYRSTGPSSVWAPSSVWMKDVPHVSNMLDCVCQFTLYLHTRVTKCLQSVSADVWCPSHGQALNSLSVVYCVMAESCIPNETERMRGMTGRCLLSFFPYVFTLEQQIKQKVLTTCVVYVLWSFERIHTQLTDLSHTTGAS